MTTRIAAAVILVSLSATPASAQQVGAPPPLEQSEVASQEVRPDRPAPNERRTMAALRMGDGETIRLDGVLDEGVWKRVVPAADFIQQDPDNGAPATEKTEVRIAYNRDSLFIGVICYDSEPDGWLGYQRRRDEALPADDRFMWTIDTYLDARTAYYFEMNPSGLMGDELQGTGTARNRQWDGIWTGRATTTEIGWILEIEIPFRTLNFNPNTDTWGINFQRTIRRKNEEDIWTGYPRNQGLRRMTNAGYLTGLTGLSQGRGLDIKPYAVAKAQASPGRVDATAQNDADVGLDLFYNPTPGLRANLTVNTDFAQAEVDQRLVNLTRFPVQYPEKRDFFLDGSTFLDFGSGFAIRGSFTPYFSRRIGLDTASGDPQKINFGAKLTGQVGNNDIGVLQVQTANEREGLRDVIGEDFTVVRLKRRILRQSYFGGIYTRRATRESDNNVFQTIGVDFQLATNNFLGSQNLTFIGFFMDTAKPEKTGEGEAFGMELALPNDPWMIEFQTAEVQTNFLASMGFYPRTGYRRFAPNVSYSQRPSQHRYVRRLSYGGNLNWLIDPHDSHLLNRDIDLTVFLMEMHSQDTFQVHVLPTFELLTEDFRISPGVTLPRGRSYSWTRTRIQASTANRRMFSVAPLVEFGSFYSGDRLRIATDFNIRVRPGLIFYTSVEWNDLDLPEGQFQTKLLRAIAETQFSPWISLVNNVQYDTQSNVLGWQSRFRWILTPGSDLYFVYTHNWVDDPLLRNHFSTLDRRLASKLMYTRRF